MGEPSAEGVVRFRCTCGVVVKAPLSLIGRRARCPKCGTVQVVPETTGSAAAPVAAPKADSQAVGELIRNVVEMLEHHKDERPAIDELVAMGQATVPRIREAIQDGLKGYKLVYRVEAISLLRAALLRIEGPGSIPPPMDPTVGDWYYRATEHIQRGDKAKALRCWDEYLRLKPDADSCARSNVDGLRSSMRPDELARYHQLNQSIDNQLAMFPSERQRRLYMFNLPHFLGIGPVDLDALKKMVNA